MQTFRKNFGFAVLLALICLTVAFVDGFLQHGHALAPALQALVIAALLGILELSLSFDNAVVNAGVLRNMDAVWQRRFLTWGIGIAVFGMRFLFPIVIVALTAHLGLGEVVSEAFGNPAGYATHLTAAHIPISAFGGCFLLLVFLQYLMDPEKDVHWFAPLESRLALAGKLDTVQVVLTAAALLGVTSLLVPATEQLQALSAGLVGIMLYLLVNALGNLFDVDDFAARAGAAGLASFIYLEVLDASFSLDGVIGAFALTNDVVIIAAGLTIGAVFVRSLTGKATQAAAFRHGVSRLLCAVCRALPLHSSDRLRMPVY